MNTKRTSPQQIGDILIKFNPLEDKYISREFQAFGCHLAEDLGDMKHKSLFIKLAKTVPRSLLEKAYSYAKDSNSKKKGAVFMWKLKDLGAWKKEEKTKKNIKAAKDIPF
jgi:hypothetical protein